MQFQEQERPHVAQQRCRSADHFGLRAFDIDLHHRGHVAGAPALGVQRGELDRHRIGVLIVGQPGESERVFGQQARAAAIAHAARADVGARVEPVQCDERARVAAQRDRWLEQDGAPRRPERAMDEREQASMGAHVVQKRIGRQRCGRIGERADLVAALAVFDKVEPQIRQERVRRLDPDALVDRGDRTARPLLLAEVETPAVLR